jgi:diaminopropionate ammonia-lyase
MPVALNRAVAEGALGPRPASEALELHRRLPGYAPTPLVELPDVARDLGVGSIHVKDESTRLGLPAFKVLGASWAIYRELSDRLGGAPEPWSSIEELSERVASLRPLGLVAATDGNHGRSVARVARWLGFGAQILVPRGTVRDRIAGIESEGAEVTVVDGGYDDTVRRAAQLQGERSLLIQDGGWPGYETIPLHVVEGYETIFREIDDQLRALNAAGPELVITQIGVGSLAAAVVQHYRASDDQPPPRIVGVEPTDANCAYASIEQGRPVTVPGPHRSMMAGLNCGTLSSLAWPWLSRGLDGVVAVEDDRAAEAMRLLAANGIESGESGAAGLAALIELTRGAQPSIVRDRLKLGPATRVLLLSTEGITDAENYARIVDDS